MLVDFATCAFEFVDWSVELVGRLVDYIMNPLSHPPSSVVVFGSMVARRESIDRQSTINTPSLGIESLDHFDIIADQQVLIKENALGASLNCRHNKEGRWQCYNIECMRFEDEKHRCQRCTGCGIARLVNGG